MSEEVFVKLKCCNTLQKVTFDDKDSSYLPPDEYRKNVICQGCEKIVILDFKKSGNLTLIDQEVIRL